MHKHKLSRLLTDQPLSGSDDGGARGGLPQTLQTKAIGGAAGKQWENGRLDAMRLYSCDVNISFNLGNHKAASSVAKLRKKV